MLAYKCWCVLFFFRSDAVECWCCCFLFFVLLVSNGEKGCECWCCYQVEVPTGEEDVWNTIVEVQAWPRKGKARSIPSPSVSSDSYSADEDYVEFLKTYKPHDGYSSGSDEIDEDYAEFLKAYDPQESYPGASSFDEAQVRCEGVSKEKEMSAPSKTAADLD